MYALMSGAILNMVLDPIFIYVFNLGALRQGICFIPIILILPIFAGLNGIIFAQPISDVICAIITAFMAIRINNALKIS